MIRRTIETDRRQILEMLADCGDFDSDGVELVNTRLSRFLAGDEHSIWLTADEGIPAGVPYCER